MHTRSAYRTVDQLLIVLLLLMSFTLLSARALGAEVSVEDGHLRYSFSETYVGADGSLWADKFQPSLSIGGTHFWGLADFYVRFPLGSVKAEKGTFSPGIDTSFHIYPFRLEKDSIRPYIGAGWSVASYEREDGPVATRHWFPVKAGIGWRKNSHLFELGATWLAGKDIEYPLDSTGTLAKADDIPRLGFSLSYKYVFDTTLHAAPRYPAERKVEQRLRQTGRLNNWGIIASPSSVFPVGNGNLPAHMDTYPPTVTYELGLSRYWYDQDFSLQAIYRPNTVHQAAFGDNVSLKGRSLRVEGLKFLPLDYHGFVPFVGVGLGYEDWQHDRSWASNERTSGWAPSVSFGWEIRPTGKERFYLRQSMRYTPASAGAPVDMFDVSFIQFIYYLGR